MSRRTPLVVLSTAIVFFAVPALLFAWGDVGHRLTGEAAALRMPLSMPAFFRAASRQLGYLNPEPDRWKDKDEYQTDPALSNGTFPDHFVDMEMVPREVLSAALRAKDRFGYTDTLAAAGAKAAVMGTLPFQILEGAQRLRVDFRNWRIAPDSTKRFIEQRIIDDAGILGHYVADGSNPAHTSIHFNGWDKNTPNPNGYATDNRFHARFETIYVGSHVKLADVLARVDNNARVLPDFRTAIIEYLNASNAQLEPLYKVDKAHPFDVNTTAPENKTFAVERLAAGARMLRDIWYTAWVTSAPQR